MRLKKQLRNVFGIFCFGIFLLLYLYLKESDPDVIFRRKSSSYVRPLPIFFPSSSSSSSLSPTELNDILFTVKTSAKFHSTRVKSLLETWVPFALDQTILVTDDEDEELRSKLEDGLVVAEKCGTSHNNADLCCKMGVELDVFLSFVSKRWWCHVDDDTYVNVPAMLDLLRGYDHRQDWYLGKPYYKNWSIQVYDRYSPRYVNPGKQEAETIRVLFGTGGAGICISRPLAEKMMGIAGQGRFGLVCEVLRHADDVIVGYIADRLLLTPLTIVKKLHTNEMSMTHVEAAHMREQATLGYPNRTMKQLHCSIFPETTVCAKSLIGVTFTFADRG